MSRNRSVAIISLIVLAIGWGAIPLIVREDIAFQSLVSARVTLGAITMLVLMAATGRIRFPQSHRPQIVGAGVLLAIHWAAFFWALKLTTVAVALAVAYLGPVAASALAPRFLKESVPSRVYAALGVAFAGVLLVVAQQSSNPDAGTNTLGGIGAALVAAVTVTALMLISKAAVDSVGPLLVTTGELVVASIVLSPWLGGAMSGIRQSPVPLLILGVVLTGFAFLGYWNAMHELSVAEVSVLMHIEPASAVVLAMLFLSETPAVWQWIGIGMVITGGLMAATANTAEEVANAPANL